ncbi:cyclin [Gregarina niphandrodes]|uniref:Cyclin n=1 Tax=Gregarina niphandrodes TaxID=110365 RepID=A0A023B433_GRENI|nr:cyclin [Gregarina niphandrodes]EZG56349.1 cyclin [Gregarina niphandrodes]|eukprot:XP_011131278.1 cyclin [Gregarina niphandrodes]
MPALVYLHPNKTTAEKDRKGVSKLNPQARARIINFLVHCQCKLPHPPSPFTLHVSVSCFDRFCGLTLRKGDKDARSKILESLSAVAAACFHLASKIEDVWPLDPADLSLSASGAFSVCDILLWERRICHVLDFKISVPTPFDYLLQYLKMIEQDEKRARLKSKVCSKCQGPVPVSKAHSSTEQTQRTGQLNNETNELSSDERQQNSDDQPNTDEKQSTDRNETDRRERDRNETDGKENVHEQQNNKSKTSSMQETSTVNGRASTAGKTCRSSLTGANSPRIISGPPVVLSNGQTRGRHSESLFRLLADQWKRPKSCFEACVVFLLELAIVHPISTQIGYDVLAASTIVMVLNVLTDAAAVTLPDEIMSKADAMASLVSVYKEYIMAQEEVERRLRQKCETVAAIVVPVDAVDDDESELDPGGPGGSGATGTGKKERKDLRQRDTAGDENAPPGPRASVKGAKSAAKPGTAAHYKGLLAEPNAALRRTRLTAYIINRGDACGLNISPQLARRTAELILGGGEWAKLDTTPDLQPVTVESHLPLGVFGADVADKHEDAAVFFRSRFRSWLSKHIECRTPPGASAKAALLCFCLVGGAPPPVTGPGQYSRDVYQDAVQPYKRFPSEKAQHGVAYSQQAERLIDNPRLPKGQVDGRAWAVPKFEDPKNDHPTTDPKNDAKIEEHDAEAETKGLTVPEPSPAALPLADVTSIDEATSSLDAPLGDDIDSEEPAPQPESTNPSPEESKPVGSLVDVFNKWGSNFGFEVVADISDGEESWGIQTIVEEVPSRSLYDSIGSIFNYLLS